MSAAAQVTEALAHYNAGRLDEAERACRAVLSGEPDQPDACLLLAVLLEQRGLRLESLTLLDRALVRAPAAPLLHLKRGNLLLALGRLDAAAPALARSIALAPDQAEAINNLAFVLRQQGRTGEALRLYGWMTRLAPGHFQGHFGRAGCLTSQGRLREAAEAARRAVRLRPEYAPGLTLAGTLLAMTCDATLGLRLHRLALRVAPQLAQAWLGRGTAALNLGRLDEALACFRNVLALEPTDASSLTNLSIVLPKLGCHGEGLAHARRAVRLSPWNLNLHSNWAIAAAYAGGDPDRAAMLRAAMPKPAAIARSGTADPARRLRIGIVSADLRRHVVGRAYLPLIAAHDRANVEIIAYPHVPVPDEVTQAWQSACDGWRPIDALDDQAAADLIRNDAIDILVGLCSHLDGNRMGIFRARPSPIQLSLGDIVSGGYLGFDYFLGDPVITPRQGGEAIEERVVRLPGLYYGDAHRDGRLAAPDPGPVPAMAAGAVTFGSFNNPAKLSDAVLAVWFRVLAAVPGSRLLLKHESAFASPRLQGNIRAAAAEHGIAADRIGFPAATRDLASHLAAYRNVDIGLDSFPFAGSNTTIDALWMGVPVVTLTGATVVSRYSASILHTLALDDLIAGTPDGFVAAAVRLARDPARLVALRAELRSRVAASPLHDTRLRARQHERMYRALWRRRCASRIN